MTTARKIVSIIVLSLLSLSGLFGFALPAASAFTSTLVHTTYFSQDCGSGIGVGITYDGTYLWVSCYASNPDLLKADPLTGTVLATYNIESGMGSMAYDSTKNGIWAAAGGGSLGNDVIFIQLDASHNVVGSPTVAFNPGFGILVDGFALDGATSQLYYSPDGSTTIYVYTETGSLVRSFTWTGTGCYNSGLGIGGSLLFQGSDGCSHVWVVDKNTLAPAFDFSTGGTRDEGLTCDPNTFAPTYQVMWSKEAYSPNRAFAFSIPANTCGAGGQPPSSGVPQFNIPSSIVAAAGFAALSLFIRFRKPSLRVIGR